MNAQKNLTKQLKKIRGGLSKKERFMFNTLNSFMDEARDSVLESIGAILMKKKYKNTFNAVQSPLEIRRTARAITKDADMEKIRGKLDTIEVKARQFIKVENKRIYKEDMRDIAAAINKELPFIAKPEITEDELRNIENMLIQGQTLKHYIKKLFAGILELIERSIKRNIVSKKAEAAATIRREIENRFETDKKGLQMIMFNFNSSASNMAFYEALRGFKRIKKS